MLADSGDIRISSTLIDVETNLCMNVMSRADNGGLCVIPIYKPRIKWWQRAICGIFRIEDSREHPPCVKHGSMVVVLGETHYEGMDVPFAYQVEEEP